MQELALTIICLNFGKSRNILYSKTMVLIPDQILLTERESPVNPYKLTSGIRDCLNHSLQKRFKLWFHILVTAIFNHSLGIWSLTHYTEVRASEP